MCVLVYVWTCVHLCVHACVLLYVVCLNFMMIIIEMTLSVIQWKNWGLEREKNFFPEHTMAKSMDLILNFALLIQEASVTFGLSHFQDAFA